VRIFFAKILLCVAVGLLFSHQFIAHHHYEDAEMTSNHHDDNHDADHHQNHLPPHHIAHIFSFDNAGTVIVKAPVQEIYFDLPAEFLFQRTAQLKSRKEYVEIRPPVSRYHKYFSLRAPPTVS